MIAILRATREHQARHRRNGRQRFATKAQTRHAFEFFQTADFAGGVARQGQHQFVTRNATSIVGNADALDAALLQVDTDFCRAGVEAVFQ